MEFFMKFWLPEVAAAAGANKLTFFASRLKGNYWHQKRTHSKLVGLEYLYIVCRNRFFQVNQIQPEVQLPYLCLLWKQNPDSQCQAVFLPTAKTAIITAITLLDQNNLEMQKLRQIDTCISMVAWWVVVGQEEQHIRSTKRVFMYRACSKWSASLCSCSPSSVHTDPTYEPQNQTTQLKTHTTVTDWNHQPMNSFEKRARYKNPGIIKSIISVLFFVFGWIFAPTIQCNSYKRSPKSPDFKENKSEIAISRQIGSKIYSRILIKNSTFLSDL